MINPSLDKAIQTTINQIPKEHLEEFLKMAQSFIAQKKTNVHKPDVTLGLFSDDAELLDEIVESAMKNREQMPLRGTDGKHQ